MANPSPKRVKLVKANVERLQASLLRLHDQCGHWAPEMGLEIEGAGTHLAGVLTKLDALPDDYVPPRKAIVRAYTTLKVGDHAQVREHAEKHTPETLRKCALEIVAIEGDLAHVKKDGVVYAIRRATLKLFEAPAE